MIDLLKIDNNLKGLALKTFKRLLCKYYPEFVKSYKKNQVTDFL